MIRIIKIVFHSWLIKYWYIFVLSLIIGASGAITSYKIKEQTKHYSANFLGCTLLLNFNSLFVYLKPLNQHINEGNLKEAANILNLKPEDLQNIKQLYIQNVAEVTEESDVRYEFNLVADIENDTAGLWKLEKALVGFMKKHQLLISLKKNIDSVYLENKKIIESEFSRLDSALRSLSPSDIANREVMLKRKVELKLQLNELLAKRKKVFDLVVIQDFNHTVIEKQPVLWNYLKGWLGVTIITGLILVGFMDKEIKRVIFED